MTAPVLDPDIYGCASRNGYSYGPKSAHISLKSLKGRPRQILFDRFPPIQFRITMELTDDKFSKWQEFWTESTKNGAYPFIIHLRRDLLETYNSGAEFYEVRALTPWSASYSPIGVWDVSLQVETRQQPPVLRSLCDIIYAGPISDPATDIVASETVDSLPTDIIAPCPYVEPERIV